MPTANLAVLYSTIQQQGYTGNFGTIQRDSDNAVMDVPFVNGIPDITSSAATSFVGSANIRWIKVYDQSGNANHFVAPSFAVAPDYNPLTDFAGIRPISFAGVSNQNLRYMRLTNGLTGGTNQGICVYQMANRHNYGENETGGEFTSDTTYANGTSVQQWFTGLGHGDSISDQGTIKSVPSSMLERSHPQTLALLSRSTGSALRIDGTSYALAAPATAAAIVGHQVGALTNTTGYSANRDLFLHAIYTMAHTDVQAAAIEATMNGAFAFDRAASNGWTKKIIYAGSSLISAFYATLAKNTARLIGFGRGSAGGLAEWECDNVALSNRMLVTEASTFNSQWKSNYNSGRTKNVLVIDAPSNDISNATFTSQADAEAWATDFFGTTTGARTGTSQANVALAYINNAKTAGFAVVVPTCIARGTFTTANYKEYARLKYNGLVTANASANGFIASDRASVSQLQDPTNLTYFASDQTHLTDVGRPYLAAVDKAAILSA